MCKSWTVVSPLVYRGFLLFAVVCVSFGQISGSRSKCRISQCSDEYGVRQGLITDSSSSLQNCWALLLYKQCCEKHKLSCWTDLNFRLTLQGITLKMAHYENCRNVDLPKENLEDFYKQWTHERTDTSSEKCVVRTESSHQFCALFGDPHLWTFRADKQTCIVAGARSLIRKNKFLAVQVTNVEVPDVWGSKATATSKVTVVLYDYEKGCVSPKTYQATSGNLPSTFTDGSIQTGPSENPAQIQQVKLSHEKFIKIKINYISTTIIIHQVGKYLTFSMVMPTNLIGNSTKGLCVKGCPSYDRIDYSEVLYGQGENVRMVRRDAEKICRSTNAIGFFFDSCLFDLMTTGNVNFSRAASTAMEDALYLIPDLDVSHSTDKEYSPNIQQKNTVRTRNFASKHESRVAYIYILSLLLLILHVWR